MGKERKLGLEKYFDCVLHRDHVTYCLYKLKLIFKNAKRTLQHNYSGMLRPCLEVLLSIPDMCTSTPDDHIATRGKKVKHEGWLMSIL